MNEQTIIRVSKNKDNPYVMIDRRTLEDVRLSLQAKGLLAYLLSRPDDWEIRMKHIVEQSKSGRDAHYSAMTELMGVGYVVRDEYINEKNHKQYRYTVHENPCIRDFSKQETSILETRILNNNELTNIDDDLSEPGKPVNIFTLYQDVISPTLGKILADELAEYGDRFPLEHVTRAFRIAAENNARSWKYVRTILDNWESHGYDWTPGSREVSKQTLEASNVIKPDSELTKEELAEREYQDAVANIRY